MAVPDDVLDYIFSFLQSDIRALKACSQSDPKFERLVERHLYANIALNDHTSGHDVRTVDSFIGLLSDNPHIANYVRSLDVVVTLDVAESIPLLLENVASILRMCSLLRKISFSAPHTGQLLEWASLPENFRLAFLDCIRLPSMKAVSISLASDFPLTALNHSKSVKSLTLCGLGFITETPRYPLLEDLAIQDCSREAVQKIIAWVQPSNLRSLEVMLLASHDREQLSGFFSSCSNTLTDLTLDIKSEFQTSCPGYAHPATTMFISLSSLLCLERLIIRADLQFHRRYRCSRDRSGGVLQFRSSIPSIARVLKTALPLQHLTLNFDFNLSTHYFIAAHYSESLWSPLVSLVSESPSPYVNLCVMASGLPNGPMTDHILSSFSRCTDLTRMVEQGVLVITPELPPPIEEPIAAASPSEQRAGCPTR